MDEKDSQENDIETAININGLLSEMKCDMTDILSITKQHRESIEDIVVPLYIDDQYVEENYAVTYSKTDKSIIGWTINNKENGDTQPDVYFKLGKDYDFPSFDLYKKILLISYIEKINGDNCKYLVLYSFILTQKYA